VDYASQDSFPHGRDGKVVRQTPRGAVTIYWHVGEGTRDGSVIAHPDEIHQYSTITHFAVILPPDLPVIACLETPGGDRDALAWLRINGMVPAYYQPAGADRRRPNCRNVKLPGGLNIILAGLQDAE
jgi:hypothetical protein